ncbi:FtsK/SpoIIIE domain-containing protein [Nocardioides eburneiflavus]|uniref:FtsK/SpoIIIE domain-containing protein n=1 Tax=Nocardioides eburneiflavus TaxID=2518372 RepID=UPI00143D9DD1|nr:FtsK/SpoIIIE domain-containing protein [Nocardioides eburneiflavus]
MEVTKRSLSLAESIAASTLGAVFGFWWDRPGLVKPKADEKPWETHAQVSSAIFWPTLAVWLSLGLPKCPEWVKETAGWATQDTLSIAQWTVLVTVFAAWVLMRRMLAAKVEKWPNHRLVRDVQKWGVHHRWLGVLFVAACIAPPVAWALLDTVRVDAINTGVFLGLAALVAHLELRWRRLCRRRMPHLIEAHRLSQRTADSMLEIGALRPRKGGGFVISPVPAEAVAHLDGLDERVALHLPEFEAKMHTDSNGAATAFEYLPASPETVARREVMARTGGFLTAIAPAEEDNPARPGECVGTLEVGITESRAEELDATLRASDGLALVQWRKGERVVHLAALDTETLTERGRIADWLSCKPWDLDLLVTTDGADVTGWHATRVPAVRDPEKRRQTWLTMANDLHPSPDSRTWTITDRSGEGEIEMRLIVDPLDVIVPFNLDVTETITPDTPWVVGIDEEGGNIEINLALSAHALIAGATRSGKSVCTYSLLTHVLRMGDRARLLVADPNDTTIAPFEDKVAWSTSDTHPDAVTGMLEWVRGEMDRRKPILRDMRADKISEFTAELPMIVVVIDEAANYLRHNDKRAAAAMMGELLAVVSQGAKYGVRLVLITQRPDSTILPTSTRAQLSFRISFRVEDGETAKMVFPDLPDPMALLTCAPGVGYVREVGGEAKRFRSVYLADHWGIADRLPHRQPKILDVAAGFGAPFVPPAVPKDMWGTQKPAAVVPAAPGEVLIDEVVLTLDDLEGEVPGTPGAAEGLDDFEFEPVTAPPTVRRRPTAQPVPDDLWA